eukprot:1160546-Pelagomonas_calceolata.AAC.12
MAGQKTVHSDAIAIFAASPGLPYYHTGHEALEAAHHIDHEAQQAAQLTIMRQFNTLIMKHSRQLTLQSLGSSPHRPRSTAGSSPLNYEAVHHTDHDAQQAAHHIGHGAAHLTITRQFTTLITKHRRQLTSQL